MTGQNDVIVGHIYIYFFLDQTIDDLFLVVYMFKAGEPCFLVFHTRSLQTGQNNRGHHWLPPNKSTQSLHLLFIHPSIFFSHQTFITSLSAAPSAKQPCDSGLLSFLAGLFSPAFSSSAFAVSPSDFFCCFCGFFLYMRFTFSTPLPDQYPWFFSFPLLPLCTQVMQRSPM